MLWLPLGNGLFGVIFWRESVKMFIDRKAKYNNLEVGLTVKCFVKSPGPVRCDQKASSIVKYFIKILQLPPGKYNYVDRNRQNVMFIGQKV